MRVLAVGLNAQAARAARVRLLLARAPGPNLALLAAALRLRQLLTLKNIIQLKKFHKKFMLSNNFISKNGKQEEKRKEVSPTQTSSPSSNPNLA